MDEHQKKSLEERVEKEFPEFIRMLERCFGFEKWGFDQSFAGVATQFPPSVIYDSEWCRVRFMWQIPDRNEKSGTLSIKYGRLHAPTDQAVIAWNGKKCYCWHDVNNVVSFLDGLSAQETVHLGSKWPRVMKQFQESNINQNWSQPEWLARMHNSIWNHYGQHLFELFDLRHTELWDEYTTFVKEYYKLAPGSFVPGLPADQDIC